MASENALSATTLPHFSAGERRTCRTEAVPFATGSWKANHGSILMSQRGLNASLLLLLV
jgi:hypothetical protein